MPGPSTTAREIESSFGAIPKHQASIEGFLADYIAKPKPPTGPAADLWRKTLARIPTHFGRLAFVSSLRDAPTGRYLYPALTEAVGTDIAERTLCHSHHQLFDEWLRFSLPEQKADLDDYLRSSQSPPRTLPYRDLAPSTAYPVERQLYLTDLETLLQLLCSEDGGPFSIPEA